MPPFGYPDSATHPNPVIPAKAGILDWQFREQYTYLGFHGLRLIRIDCSLALNRYAAPDFYPDCL